MVRVRAGFQISLLTANSSQLLLAAPGATRQRGRLTAPGPPGAEKHGPRPRKRADVSGPLRRLDGSQHLKEPAMTVHPKNQKDLMLAPVAVEIDRNLQRLRVDSQYGVLAELELELDRPAMRAERDERADLVLRQALRDVDLHGWTA